MKKTIALFGTALMVMLIAACGYASVQAGDTIQFGEHAWRVLEVRDGRALILSDEILELRPYHSNHAGITWEHCSLREYLNGWFYDNRFTTDEKNKIAEVRNSNPANQWFEISGGENTIDKVFLLSLEEVVRYFGDSGQLANKPDYVHYISDEYDSNRVAVVNDTKEASDWWLRSPGTNSYYAARVVYDGRVYVNGFYVYNDLGVRPALWLNL